MAGGAEGGEHQPANPETTGQGRAIDAEHEGAALRRDDLVDPGFGDDEDHGDETADRKAQDEPGRHRRHQREKRKQGRGRDQHADQQDTGRRQRHQARHQGRHDQRRQGEGRTIDPDHKAGAGHVLEPQGDQRHGKTEHDTAHAGTADGGEQGAVIGKLRSG